MDRWPTWTPWPASPWTSTASTLSVAATTAASGMHRTLLSSNIFTKRRMFRLWNLESKTCVQEITAHRKKFDESIFDVAFHPTRPYIASAGLSSLSLSTDIVNILTWTRLIEVIFQELMLWRKFSSNADGFCAESDNRTYLIYSKFLC